MLRRRAVEERERGEGLRPHGPCKHVGRSVWVGSGSAREAWILQRVG